MRDIALAIFSVGIYAIGNFVEKDEEDWMASFLSCAAGVILLIDCLIKMFHR
jgi:hypothetical protein